MPRNYLRKIPTNEDELYAALWEAYMMARRHKLRTKDEYDFEANAPGNIKILMNDILSGRYEPGRSKAFITHTPVDREIFAASFRDRIVHHLLYGIVARWWEEQFIDHSFSCREGKGNLLGAETLQKDMREAQREGGGKARGLKGDLSGFFMSMKRQILYTLVCDGLEQQFPDKGWTYELCEFLWRKVIFDDPTVGVRRVGSKADWKRLPMNKSLFCQPEGVGIVIGNLTSQLLSNIMLHKFDLYVTEELGYKHYGRYVDDFYIIVPESEADKAWSQLNHEIADYLKGMGLKLHPKKLRNQPVQRGMDFLGWWVKPKKKEPSRRFRKNFRKAARDFEEGHGSLESLVSYLGTMKHSDSQRIAQQIFDEIGWDYVAF